MILVLILLFLGLCLTGVINTFWYLFRGRGSFAKGGILLSFSLAALTLLTAGSIYDPVYESAKRDFSSGETVHFTTDGPPEIFVPDIPELSVTIEDVSAPTVVSSLVLEKPEKVVEPEIEVAQMPEFDTNEQWIITIHENGVKTITASADIVMQFQGSFSTCNSDNLNGEILFCGKAVT